MVMRSDKSAIVGWGREHGMRGSTKVKTSNGDGNERIHDGGFEIAIQVARATVYTLA
jgi:hypothetical protein